MHYPENRGKLGLLSYSRIKLPVLNLPGPSGRHTCPLPVLNSPGPSGRHTCRCPLPVLNLPGPSGRHTCPLPVLNHQAHHTCPLPVLHSPGPSYLSPTCPSFTRPIIPVPYLALIHQAHQAVIPVGVPYLS